MKKKLIFIIIFIAAAACIPKEENVMSESEPWDTTTGFEQPQAERPAKTANYTMAEVAKHDSERDCWLVLGGKAYNVTKFIPFHPGGEAILQGCGKDATRLFETRPMGSGTPHSSLARETAVKYFAGAVK